MSNGSCICRLRKLSRDLDGEITTLFVSEIPGPIVNFWDLSMDDKYVLLFYSRKEEVGVARSRIEVRNATTFDLDATILFRSDVFYHFHYFNGIAVTAQTGKFIRFKFKLFLVFSEYCFPNVAFVGFGTYEQVCVLEISHLAIRYHAYGNYFFNMIYCSIFSFCIKGLSRRSTLLHVTLSEKSKSSILSELLKTSQHHGQSY